MTPAGPVLRTGQRADFLELNPNGQVPVILDENGVL